MYFRLEADGMLDEDDFGSRVTVEFEANDLETTLQHLMDFLRGAGFCFNLDEHLAVVGPDGEGDLTQVDLETECFSPHRRNRTARPCDPRPW